MSSPPHPSVQLIKALQSHNVLSTLVLNNTGIGLSECATLAQWLLSPTCSLEVLDIGENNITSEGTQIIITTLCQNCTLCELGMSHLDISGQLRISVFGRPLVSLDLMNCGIGPEEACEVARTLYSNTVLESLDLSLNSIEDRGAIALADMLLHNKKLKHLYLWDFFRSFTAKGTQALLQSLEHNNTLRTLMLSKIELPHEISD